MGSDKLKDFLYLLGQDLGEYHHRWVKDKKLKNFDNKMQVWWYWAEDSWHCKRQLWYVYSREPQKEE